MPLERLESRNQIKPVKIFQSTVLVFVIQPKLNRQLFRPKYNGPDSTFAVCHACSRQVIRHLKCNEKTLCNAAVYSLHIGGHIGRIARAVGRLLAEYGKRPIEQSPGKLTNQLWRLRPEPTVAWKSGGSRDKRVSGFGPLGLCPLDVLCWVWSRVGGNSCYFPPRCLRYGTRKRS
jgi:hypothetical protein